VVEARSAVRDRLHGEGLDLRLGGLNRFMSVADAVDRLIDGKSVDAGTMSGRSE
jgi:hypothetical protein